MYISPCSSNILQGCAQCQPTIELFCRYLVEKDITTASVSMGAPVSTPMAHFILASVIPKATIPEDARPTMFCSLEDVIEDG